MSALFIVAAAVRGANGRTETAEMKDACELLSALPGFGIASALLSSSAWWD
jgi:hypothetical protein